MLGIKCLRCGAAKLAGAATVALLAVASHASAAIITTTYTGTVTSGSDSAGEFGSAGANLAGDSYNLVFTIDPALGTYSTFSSTIADPNEHGDQVIGGVSAVLTINGHSRSFPGPIPGGAFDIAVTGPDFDEVVQSVGSPSGGQVAASLYTTNVFPSFPASVYTVMATSTCPGAGTCGGNFNTSGSFGTLGFGTYSVAVAPIPATLPLLISALGGLGFFGWQRKKRQAA